ncbi:Transposase [Candidatus Methanomarinus sp.]|nr:Transposase [ANME-2 cluster archaeon]
MWKGIEQGRVTFSALTSKIKYELGGRNMDHNIKILIGIDVSKDKQDICIKNNNGNILKRLKIKNTKEDLDKLYTIVDKLKANAGENADAFFGMEATGIYCFPLYSALKRDGCLVKLFNPIQTDGYRKMEIRKTKTDSIDSAIIADMLLYHEPPVSTAFDNLAIYQLRELCRVRQRNVEKRTKCKIQLIRNLDLVWPGYKSIMKSILGKTSMAILKRYSVPSNVAARPFEEIYGMIKKVSRSQIKRKQVQDMYNHTGCILTVPEIDSVISVEIKTLVSEIELYNEQIQALEKTISQLMSQIDSQITTIPGIGNNLGAVILGEIGEVGRFSNVKKLVAFAGLDPIVKSSGNFKNKSGPISKRGSPDLRWALFMAANVARQNDVNLRKYYEKKRNEGKHFYAALNAVAAKLLRIVYWVLNNNKEYQTQLA